MSALTKKQALKIWNVRLKVSSEEERKIKMEAIQKGMMISEYIKQTVLNDLSSNRICDSGK